MGRIILTKGMSTKVDEEDCERLKDYTWHAQESGYTWYARTNLLDIDNKYIIVSMHVLIYKIHNLYDANYHIDHKDGNGLHNEKNNLQLLTHRENCLKGRMRSNNTSGYRGVHFEGPRYRAQIMVNGKKIPIGRYDTAEEAALAWNRVAKAAFGDLAYQNIIEPKHK